MGQRLRRNDAAVPKTTAVCSEETDYKAFTIAKVFGTATNSTSNSPSPTPSSSSTIPKSSSPTMASALLTASSEPQQSHGLSGGAKAGIAIGVIAGASMCFVLGFFGVMSLPKKRLATQESSSTGDKVHEASNATQFQKLDNGWNYELDTNTKYGNHSELQNAHPRSDMS
ncbi:hypothetical protein K504DRAFT_510108 [Pleomassaria siparia CBS 279.74]|uniref:Mid2 domain-containing protein n=1 Tax=Pleomassaria siparia CBS 279.74 TaxID=1314801 RepID=A0A6G1KQA8_9PLEO|nr:hypothetical protein K504DRAFT_510108 [Pleomassaria siparia CBS 279.74]